MVSTCFLIACIKHRVDYDHLQEQQTFVQQLRNVASSSTWRLIVIQGCFGMLPWDAISFMVLWFTLIGFSHQTAGLIMLTAACGAACGAVFGGWVGDKLELDPAPTVAGYPLPKYRCFFHYLHLRSFSKQCRGYPVASRCILAPFLHLLLFVIGSVLRATRSLSVKLSRVAPRPLRMR